MPNSTSLSDRLSAAEQAALTAGDGPWTIAGIRRLGIGPIKMTDGSNGARGDHFHGTFSVCFPSGSAMGATWNPTLLRELGSALAVESRRKGANILLGPTLNLHRYPLGGRNFESMGEDPLLVGTLGAAYIHGLQAGGVAAVPKHLVGNDSELERESVDVRIDERTLREVYLRPFEMAIRNGGAWAIMTAYSKLNGVYCSEHRELIDIVKGEWGFDGVVISDWGGVDSTVASARAGLDIEMPGPPDYLGSKLVEAVDSGSLEPEILQEKAERIVGLADRTGTLAAVPGAERCVDDENDRELARRAAQESIVLVKNRDVLPLNRSELSRVAVIGPAAAHTQIQGGGSARVTPPHQVSALDGIRHALGGDVDVDHAEGVSIARYTRPLDARDIVTPDGVPGALVEYYRTTSGHTQLVHSEVVTSTELTWIGAPLTGIPMAETSVVCRTTFRAATTGSYQFGLIGAGHATATIAGRSLLDSADAISGGPHFFGRGTAEVRRELQMEAGQSYDIEIRLETRVEKSATAGVIFGVLPPMEADPVGRAVELAARADVAVVAVGTNSDWEMEGGDRPDLALPGDQDDLVRAVAAANPKTVVLVNAGSAVALPFLSDVAGLLYIWFGGQEQGHAVADVLFGDVDPGGRMPMSVPARDSDMLDIRYDRTGGSRPANSGSTITHVEQGRIGYRHHEAIREPAAVPFGHGLSYGDIEVTDARFRSVDSGPMITVDIRNSGQCPGIAVPQVYVRGVEDGEPKRLAAFAKFVLQPEEARTVELAIPDRAFSHWSIEHRVWEADSGQHLIEVGFSAQHIVWTYRLADLRPATPQGG